MQILVNPLGIISLSSAGPGNASVFAELVNDFAVLDNVHVNDWIVSAFGFGPSPLGVIPDVERGPVVMRRAVTVFEIKGEKIGMGEVTEETMRVVSVVSVEMVERIVKRVVLRVLWAARVGITWARRVIRDRRRIRVLVVRVRRVGVVFVLAGQSWRENVEGRLVV